MLLCLGSRIEIKLEIPNQPLTKLFASMSSDMQMRHLARANRTLPPHVATWTLLRCAAKTTETSFGRMGPCLHELSVPCFVSTYVLCEFDDCVAGGLCVTLLSPPTVSTHPLSRRVISFATLC